MSFRTSGNSPGFDSSRVESLMYAKNGWIFCTDMFLVIQIIISNTVVIIIFDIIFDLRFLWMAIEMR